MVGSQLTGGAIDTEDKPGGAYMRAGLWTICSLAFERIDMRVAQSKTCANGDPTVILRVTGARVVTVGTQLQDQWSYN